MHIEHKALEAPPPHVPITANRENIISAFTTIKGSMIDETYAVLANWDFAKSQKSNLSRLKIIGFIETKSCSWLRDVAKVLNQRLDPAGRDRALVTLARSGCGLEEWRPLLLWHLTHEEFLFKDFLIHWLFPACFDSGAHCVRHEDLQAYLLGVQRRSGKKGHSWAATTLHRVALGLLKMATDFGFLEGNAVKQFTPYQLPERSFIYLLHVMLEKYKSARKVIHAIEWRIFLLCPSDVERELRRLHQSGRLEFDSDDGTTRLSLPCKNAGEYAEIMSQPTPGDRCEVDWADEKIEWLDPKTSHIQQAHVFLGVLGFSGLIFAWASADNEGSNWIQGHRKMYDSFGGVPRVTVCGSLRQGVIKAHRYDPELCPGYAEIAAHYMTSLVPVRPERPEDKALVKDAIRTCMRAFRLINRGHTFTSLIEINYRLANIVDRINRKVPRRVKSSRFEQWASREVHSLQPLPSVAFEAVEWSLARVHPDCTVSLESAYYSVPHAYREKDVRIKLTATHVEIFADLECVAVHKRDFARRADRHIVPEHLPDNAIAYREVVPQKLLLRARLVTKSFCSVIEDLFAKDTLGNLRRAQRLIGRAHAEIKDFGRKSAGPRIDAAVEQMRQFNNFRVHYFEATLQQLRQKSDASD